MIGLPDFLPTTIMHLSLILRVSGDAPKNCRLETYWFSDHDSDYTVDGGVVRYVGKVVWLIFFRMFDRFSGLEDYFVRQISRT